MSPSTWKEKSVFLLPGELNISDAPTQVSTVLGSCIAVTFFNKRLKYGGICHAVLPDGKGDSSFRYVDGAFEHMLQSFEQVGIGRHEIEVKLFGGAEILTGAGQGHRYLSVGRQNIEAARRLIEEKGLKLGATRIGGSEGCKVFFYTHTGDVWLRPVKKNYSVN